MGKSMTRPEFTKERFITCVNEASLGPLKFISVRISQLIMICWQVVEWDHHKPCGKLLKVLFPQGEWRLCSQRVQMERYLHVASHFGMINGEIVTSCVFIEELKFSTRWREGSWQVIFNRIYQTLFLQLEIRLIMFSVVELLYRVTGGFVSSDFLQHFCVSTGWIEIRRQMCFDRIEEVNSKSCFHKMN